MTSSRTEKPKEAEPRVVAKPRSKKSETAKKSSRKSQRETEIDDAEREASMPPVPRGSMRAKFVGVTADGQWMLMLPSHKVVVVPPPPHYP